MLLVRNYLPLIMLGLCGCLSMPPLKASSKKVANKKQSAKKDMTVASKTALIVDGQAITQEEVFQKMSEGVPGIMAFRDKNPEAFQKLYVQFLTNYLFQQLLSKKSSAAEKDLIKDEKVQQALQKAKNEVLVTAFLQSYLKQHATDAFLQELYKKNPQEMVTLFSITFATETDANACIRTLKKGQQTLEKVLASEKKALDQKTFEKKILKGGQEAPVVLSTLSLEERKALTALEVQGFVQKPIVVRLPNGTQAWRVVKLLSREVASFKQSKDVLQRLASIELFKTLVTKALKEYKVEVFDLAGKSITDKLISQ